jgi:hypothetical protein
MRFHPRLFARARFVPHNVPVAEQSKCVGNLICAVLGDGSGIVWFPMSKPASSASEFATLDRRGTAPGANQLRLISPTGIGSET